MTKLDLINKLKTLTTFGAGIITQHYVTKILNKKDEETAKEEQMNRDTKQEVLTESVEKVSERQGEILNSLEISQDSSAVLSKGVENIQSTQIEMTKNLSFMNKKMDSILIRC